MMSLNCKLFRGNKRLAACLMDDAAHIMKGAVGDHVAMIQFALFALDSLRIDRRELLDAAYGPSTAAAILRYKTVRKIVNYSYQSHPDDIVGKMTIASLDRAMYQWELTHRCTSCGDIDRFSSEVPVLASFNRNQESVRSDSNPSFIKSLNIYWSITRVAAKEGRRQLEYLDKAGELVSQFGMLIVQPTAAYSDVIPNDFIVDPRFDTLAIRKASEDFRPGFPGVLRVITCPFASNSDEIAVTDRGRVGSQEFQDFILINVNRFKADRCTLIHEMIHATGLFGCQFETDQDSVFSQSNKRSVLKPEHAKLLSEAFFASA